MTFDYEAWLKTAQDRLEFLYGQKVAIETEITQLEAGIKGFAPLVNQATLWQGPGVGITDAVTNVLKSNQSRLFSAIEVRNELLRLGVSLEQKNPMATIHQVLARLVERGIVTITTHEAGRNRYKWVEGWEGRKLRRSRRSSATPRPPETNDSPKTPAS
jgi:hypothetical protein